MKKLKKEMEANWVDLSEDILGLIHNKLHYRDQICFRLVCRSWQISKSIMSCSDRLPWVVCHETKFLPPFSLKIQNESELYDPYSKTVHKFSSSTHDRSRKLIEGKNTLYSSKYGWMLYGNKGVVSSLFLHNPLSNKVILLPKLDYEYKAATFTTNPSSVDCEVLVLCCYGKALYMSRCSIHSAKREWRRIILEYLNYDDCVALLCVGDKMYCLFYYGTLKIYSLVHESWDLVVYRPPELKGFIPKFATYWLNQDNNGDITMVKRSMLDEWVVFKFDSVTKIWVGCEVRDLRRRMMFISDKVLTSISNYEIDGVENTGEDCRIFYLDNGFSGSGEFKCYSLKERGFVNSETYGWIGKQTGSLHFIEPPCLGN